MDSKAEKAQNNAVNRYRSKVLRGLQTLSMRFTKGKKESMVNRGSKTGFIRTEIKLNQSITTLAKKNAGTIESISFRFERHGIFVEKGVSKSHSTSNTRRKKAWIQPVLNTYTPPLADKIAEINANEAINLKI